MTTPFEELTHHAESALRILRGATHSRAARDAAGCLTEGLARAKALEALAAPAPLPSESEPHHASCPCGCWERKACDVTAGRGGEGTR